MKPIPHTLILFLFASTVLVASANAQALNITVSHQVTQVSSMSDGSSLVTLQLTVHNASAENVTALRLLSMPGDGWVLPTNQLEMDSLASGTTTEHSWSLSNKAVLSSTNPILDQLTFSAEATDANQTLHSFPIISHRGTEQ